MDSQRILDALFEYATEGIMVTNKAGEIVRINPSAERLFGYTKDELIGKRIELLIPDRFSGHHSGHRDHFFAHPKNRAMGSGNDLFAKRKDGSEFAVEISLSHYELEGEHFVISFIIDVSERKIAADRIKNHSIELEKQVHDRTLILQEAVNELEKTKVELKDALAAEKELNDLKSRFVAMASHEFRTPLATILSSLSLVVKYNELNEPEKRDKHIARIKSSVVNMTEILNDFLSLSKLEEGKIAHEPEHLDLSLFCEFCVQEMTAVAKPEQKLVYQHKGAETRAFLDKKLLKGVLTNLMSNDIKFSDEGKTIWISSMVSENEVVLKIKDAGIGISKEDQKRLFERFFRAQNAFNIQGTGLGLNIISKYIELMNGEIEVESELNVGTAFTVTFFKNALHEENSTD